jgi:hypothetical protein
MLSRKVITLIIYLFIISIICTINPEIIFDKDGNLKTFGNKIDDDTTFLPILLILPIFALLTYLIVLVFEIIYT